jgi:hypothetical protein
MLMLMIPVSFTGRDAEVCYKDSRSDERGNAIILARWSNHHVPGSMQF